MNRTMTFCYISQTAFVYARLPTRARVETTVSAMQVVLEDDHAGVACTLLVFGAHDSAV